MLAISDECVDEVTVELSTEDVARLRARIRDMDEEEQSFSLDAPPLMLLDAVQPVAVVEAGHTWAQATLVASCVAASVVLVLGVYAM